MTHFRVTDLQPQLTGANTDYRVSRLACLRALTQTHAECANHMNYGDMNATPLNYRVFVISALQVNSLPIVIAISLL